MPLQTSKQRHVDAIYFPGSTQNHRQHNDDQNDCQNQKQAACLPSRLLLIPIGAPELKICVPCIRSCVLYVLRYRVDPNALLMHDVCDVAEQLVEFTNTLLNVSDL